ncbi:MAG TPA: hypothetical protein VK689_06860 [Armatimonadota bacterium]|nr:hypothetical protein [Armatimonadota bacterium]
MTELPINPDVWCLPLNLTENSLHAGSVIARRIPDVLARMLRLSGVLHAEWAPLVVEVEEGLGYVVTVATADDTESREHLEELRGEYLLFGQLDVTEEQLWLDGRLLSRRRDEVLLYPRFAGTREAFLEWMPEWAREVAAAVRGPLPPELDERLSQPVTRVWNAFRFYCNALDNHASDLRDPEWEWRVMVQVYAALENDPELEWAAELGAEIAGGCIAAGEWEHAADLEHYMSERAPDSPAITELRNRIRARLSA